MSFRVSGEPNGRSRSLSAEAPFEQLPVKDTRLGKWTNIPVPSGDLTILGKDIIETFRAYSDLKNMGGEFKIKINGSVKTPEGVSSEKGNLRPLFKWLLQELDSVDQTLDDEELEKHLDTLFTPCLEPEGLEFLESKEFRRCSNPSRLRLRRTTSLDTDPKVTALISPSELSSVLSQSDTHIEDKKRDVRKIVMRNLTENLLQDVPYIKILSGLSFVAFNRADEKIKVVFPQFAPQHKGAFQLKCNPALRTKFSVAQHKDGSFKTTQTRTYQLREDTKDGSVTPFKDLGTVKARWSVASHSSDTYTGNLTVSKIQFLPEVDALTKQNVMSLFQDALDDKSNTIQALSKAITNLPSKRHTVDLGSFGALTGPDLLAPIYTYIRAKFNLPKADDKQDFDEITFSGKGQTDFAKWFLSTILQSKNPVEECQVIYRNHFSSKFVREERHYGEMLFKPDLNRKLFLNVTEFAVSNFDESYFLALKTIGADKTKSQQLIEAIKKCRNIEDAGKAVTQAVLASYSTTTFNLASDMNKLRIMAYAADSAFDKPLKKEFASFKISSPQFRIERNQDKEKEVEVFFVPKTGEFEIEQKRFYTVKQSDDESDVLEFTLVSAITDNDGKCAGSHKAVDIKVCDGVYPSIAADALQGLKSALEPTA